LPATGTPRSLSELAGQNGYLYQRRYADDRALKETASMPITPATPRSGSHFHRARIRFAFMLDSNTQQAENFSFFGCQVGQIMRALTVAQIEFLEHCGRPCAEH